ncbi:MAG: Lipid flippase FtsW [Verrucomicrobiota bacterium]|jgi:cell division protein FtsW
MKLFLQRVREFVRHNFVMISIFTLVVAVVALISIGVLMLTSTGAYAQEAKGDPQYFLKRQLFWLGVGAIMCIGAAAIDYRKIERFRWWIYCSAVVLLLLCFVPGVGRKINGASRWIGFGSQTAQPSEIAKLAAIIMLAWWYSRKEMLEKPVKYARAKAFKDGFVIPLAIVLGLIALIAPEVDLGTSCLIGGTTLVIMFVAGARIWYLGAIGCMGIGALAMVIKLMPERTGRLLAFLDPDKFPKDAYQQIQGLIAFAAGGIGGRGLGEGMQKHSFLPYAHTDFIFPMVGEELGLYWTLTVVVCFLAILLAGTVVAMKSSDHFGKLLGFGIVTLLALQAALNMGVTTMLLPNKGLPLPFISYGGSNLAFCLAGVGILISIYRRGYGEAHDPMGVQLRAKILTRPTPRM